MEMRRAVRARAPIRLDLAGGWTDVPPFSAREGGAVVNLAINRYCYVTVRPRDRGITLYSADYDARAEAETLDALPARGGLELLKASLEVGLNGHTGTAAFDLYARCDAPPGSGTGGSGAVGVAVVGALAAYLGRPLTAHEAALQAIAAERERLGVAGGTQDQYAAAYGGASYMEFRDPMARISPLRLPPGTVAELEKRLVLTYTGVSRVSGDVAANVMAAYEAGAPKTVAALRTLRDLAAAAKAALLAGDLEALATVLTDNWRCQKDLHPSVTSAGIDALYDRALAAGAAGGKALGAGGGGCMLFLAHADREHHVRRVLADSGIQLLDFSLEWGGLQVWEGATSEA